jgi:C-terminal processing protease CtpA/Prc
MENLVCPPVSERLYGLSLIWQEANYNFAFFDRVPELDWGAAYREFIPQVSAANDLFTYYDLLAKFAALLKDGHTGVIPPKSVYLSLDRPKLTLMNIGNDPVVTNASMVIGSRVPIGSKLLEIDGRQSEEYLSTTIIPLVSENAPHRRRDRSMSLLLLGRVGSQVHCKFSTPVGEHVALDLLRNRGADADPWLRPSGAPGRSEFVNIYDYYYKGVPFPAFGFEMLERGVGYVALNTFMDPAVVTAFEEALPTLRGCSGLILDIRKNMGGNDSCAHSIVAHFLRQPTQTCFIRSKKHIAVNKAHGVNMKDTPTDRLADLSEWERENLLCYRNQWFHEESWGQVQPAAEILSLPTAILTSSETNSAADDFLMAFQSGKGEGIRIGGSTSGSSGQPLEVDLPGGGLGYICTVRMPEPEEVWQKGIMPHIRVEPTVEDIIHDEDRVLNTAMGYLCG